MARQFFSMMICTAFAVLFLLAIPANAKDIYVAVGGSDSADGSSGAPYASVEKGVTAAMGAGDVIHIGEGTFALPTDVTLENTTGWKLQGAGIGKTILSGGNRHVRCFNLGHADAELSGFTLSGVTWNRDDSSLDRKYKGCAIYMTAGVIHDVRVTGATSAKTYWTSGTALYMTGGRVSDCIIDGGSGAQGECYGIVYQSGGLTERCMFYGNGCSIHGGALWMSGGTNSWSVFYGNVAKGKSAQGGAVCMSGGTLMHATIWGNGAGTDSSANTGALGGGLYHAGGVVTNCLVWGNSAPSQSESGKPDWFTTKNDAQAATLVFNLCTTDAKGTNPIPLDPQLKDPANGDFSLLASSPCILADGTTVGATPYDRTKPDAAMTVSPRSVFSADVVSFASTVRNVANPVYSWTVTDAAGAVAKTSSEASFSSTFDAGIYDVTLVVTDGETPVATDTRPAYFRVHALTNVIEQAAVAAEATAELKDAIENAPDGQVIILGEGEWTLPNVTLLVDKNVKIFGQGVDKTFLHGGSRAAVCFTVSHKDAELAHFTLNNLTWNSDNRLSSSACFNLSNGFLHDLAVTNINCDKTGNMIGLGTYMTGGHLADVVYDNCHGSRGDMVMNGSGVRQTGGLSERLIIRNCYGRAYGGLYLSGGSNTYSRIYNNVARNNSAQGGGVTMTGGTLVHATIWGNGAGTDNIANTGAQGGGLYHSGGVVTNCIVWGNSAPSQTATGKPDWYTTKSASAASYFFNLCSPVALGVGAIDADPQFVDAPNGDFSVQSSSPCIFETFTVGAVEYDRSQPDAAMTVSPVKAFDTETVEFTSTIQNIADPRYAWMVTDSDGEIVKTSTEAGFSATFAKGVYDIRLVVSDGDKEVKTDERLAYLTIYAKTNTVAAGVKDALKDALADTFDGQVFLLEDGIHEVTATLTLDKNLKLIGGGSDKCIIKKTGSANRAILINNSEALVTGVAITGGGMGDGNEERNSWGLGVLIGDNGGTVSWCCITNNKTSGHFMRGGGVGMTGNGLVSHCIIADNSVKHLQADYGGGAALSNGRLENCLITDNEAIYGGGVALAGSGKVRNCTIVGNTASGGSGGLCWWNASSGSAEVRNCIFSGNTADQDTSSVKPNVGYVDGNNNKQVYMSCSNSVFSCAYEGSALLGVGSVAVADPFEGAATGDYRLKLSAAAVNAGTDYDGIAELDLAAGPRVIGENVDVGAYETDTEVFGASFAMDKTEALQGVAFTATATVNGTDDFDCEWTVYGPGGAAAATFEGAAWTNAFEAEGWYAVEMTVTDRADGSKTLTDRRANSFYVAPTRIDLAENASIHDALVRALDGTKICLSAGEYVTTARVTVAKGVVIEGPGYKACTVKAGTNWVGDRRVFYLNHPDALLRGMTITGGRMGTAQSGVGDARNLSGGGVHIAINGGTVEDCRITGNRSGSYQNCGGGVGIASAQGVVRNCIIDHNTVLCTSTQEYGGGAYLTAGVMSNCVIHSNVALDGGGVYLADSAALVANCTIVSNRASNAYGGLYMTEWATEKTRTKVRDSIIWGNVDANVSPNDGTTMRPEYGAGGVINNDNFNYCAFSEGTKLPTDDARNLMGEGNITCDPGFKDFEKLDFRFHYDSPCVWASSSGLWIGALPPVKGGLIFMFR